MTDSPQGPDAESPADSPQPLAHLERIHPYVPGEGSADDQANIIKLSSNENPLGPSPNVVNAYQRAVRSLHLYPEGGATPLREAIAKAEGLQAGRIVCGAGSDELISLLCQCYLSPGDETLYSEHGFAMYPISTQAFGGTPVAAPETNLRADVDALLERAGPKTKIAFLANPNNPTGSYLNGAEIRRLREGLPAHTLLVIDGAYTEYVEADDYDDGIAMVEEREDVVVTRTFSKIHGLAALRLGWAYCPPTTVEALHRVRGPFNTSGPAQAAGVAAISDRDYIDHCRLQNALWRSWLKEKLSDLGIGVSPSVANFILIEFAPEGPRTAAAADAFLRERGLILRRMEGYGLANHLRLSVGAETENREVVAALAAFMGKGA